MDIRLYQGGIDAYDSSGNYMGRIDTPGKEDDNSPLRAAARKDFRSRRMGWIKKISDQNILDAMELMFKSMPNNVKNIKKNF